MEPLFYGAARFLLIGLILLVFIRNFSFLREWRALKHLGISALLILGFISLFTIGVDLSSALKALLFSLTTPIWMYILSVLLLGEPIVKRALVGTLIALSGSLLLVGLPPLLGASLVLGDLLLLLAFLFLAASIISGKYLFYWMEPVAMISIRFLIAGTLILIMTLGWYGPGVVLEGSQEAWLALMYAVLLSGVAGLSLYYTSLRNLRGEQAAPLFYLDPAAGVLVAALFLGESLDLLSILGTLVVLAGVMISHPHHYSRFHRFHVPHPHPIQAARNHFHA
jgi:drug/metabolite transporter (DMT)-like permease